VFLARAPRQKTTCTRRAGSVLAGAVWVAAGLALVFTLSGCGEKSEPTGRSVSLYPVSVRDADGKLVSLERAPKRIGTVGKASAAITASLGVTSVNVAGSDGNLDPDAVRAFDPDLILVDSESNRTDLEPVMGQGIPVYVTPDQSLDAVQQAVTGISLLTGVPLRGRAERTRMARERAIVHAALAGSPATSVFFDRGGFATVSNNSFVGDVIREAGGSNVAGSDPGNEPFPLADLARLQPDVFVVVSGDPLTLSKLRRNPLTKHLPAVLSRRFVHINKQVLVPQPGAVVELRGLARALHPDVFR
jgi:ABC-type Fe3+-hydroxamate transport system substrate-binding protein